MSVNARGGWCVETREELMQPGGAVPLRTSPQVLAQIVAALRPFEEAFGQGAQVEARSAGYDGQVFAHRDVLESHPRKPGVSACRERLVRIGDIDEMMRYAGLLFAIWFCRAQVHAAIDSDRIAAYDLTAELPGERERQGGLAAPRGPEEDNEKRKSAFVLRDGLFAFF